MNSRGQVRETENYVHAQNFLDDGDRGGHSR